MASIAARPERSAPRIAMSSLPSRILASNADRRSANGWTPASQGGVSKGPLPRKERNIPSCSPFVETPGRKLPPFCAGRPAPSCRRWGSAEWAL